MKFKIFIFCSLWLMMGCNDGEEPIIPRENGEKTYQLPQGQHDYDQTIVDWYDKYRFYALYRFDKEDLYWNNTEWIEGFHELHSGQILALQADPDYVGEQLELLDRSLLSIYPDSLLTEMPLKILLCSELWKAEYVYQYPEGNVRDCTVLLTYKGFDYFAVNGGNDKIGQMEETTKLQYLKELNMLFLKHLQNKGKLTMPEEFGNVSDYTYALYMDLATAYSKGFINCYVLDRDINKAKNQDFIQFLELVTMPLYLLEAEPDRSQDYTATPSLVGALNPERDVNGWVRQKYNILIKFLKEKGVRVEQLQQTSAGEHKNFN